MQTLGIGVMLGLLCVSVAAQELTPWSNGPTPPLSLTDSRGRHYPLTAYHGRVVLVNFWATWCEPCREEMPALQQLQDKMGEERFVILAVNYGESPEKVQTFVHNTPLDFPILFDRHTEAAKAWRVRVLPTSFVLGPDGQVRYRAVGALDWEDPQVVKLIAALLVQP